MVSEAATGVVVLLRYGQNVGTVAKLSFDLPELNLLALSSSLLFRVTYVVLDTWVFATACCWSQVAGQLEAA